MAAARHRATMSAMTGLARRGMDSRRGRWWTSRGCVGISSPSDRMPPPRLPRRAGSSHFILHAHGTRYQVLVVWWRRCGPQGVGSTGLLGPHGKTSTPGLCRRWRPKERAWDIITERPSGSGATPMGGAARVPKAPAKSRPGVPRPFEARPRDSSSCYSIGDDGRAGQMRSCFVSILNSTAVCKPM